MILNQSLFKNFTWLSISQGANFIIPLFVYPYLLRIINIEGFGLVVLAQAVVTYFAYIVDYGFSITAVREVSLNRDRPEKLSLLFNRLYITKSILLLTSLVAFYLLTRVIPGWDNFLFLTSFSIVAGQLLLPVWWFQGMEKMNGVAIMNILTKIIFALLILFLIRESEDYKSVNLYLGLSQILVGLVTLVFIIVKYKIFLKLPASSSIKRQFRENKAVFLSVFAGFASGNSNLIILGLMADPVSTGYYGVVEKILLAIRAPAVLLYQSIFPKVCMLAEKSFESLLTFLKSVTRLILISFVPLGLVVFFLSDEIVFLFTGQYLEQPSKLLQMVSFVPLMAALNIPPCQTMLAYNFKSSYARITIGGAMFNIIMNIILVSAFGAYGTATAALVTEIFVTATLFINLAWFHKEYSVFRIFKII